MNKQLSRKDAAYWLNEAWAPENEILPRHVRLAGDWLFYHGMDYPEGVACIHDPKVGDTCAEPFCDIPFADSPFVEKDQEKLAKTLAKLDGDARRSGYTKIRDRNDMDAEGNLTKLSVRHCRCYNVDQETNQVKEHD